MVRIDMKKIVFENTGIKLLSLGLSLTLWFYVTSTGKTELTLTVPIELRNVPAGMTVVGDVTGSLEVRMQGQERELRDGSISKKVVAILDLSTAREGENSVRISPDDIKRPPGTLVTHVSRYDVKVRLEHLERKAFRIKPVLRGTPAEGYRMAGTTVTPPKILVEGPASVIRLLNGLETMPIDIQMANASLTVEPKIDYRGQPVKLLEKKIAVHITIERIKNEKAVRH